MDDLAAAGARAVTLERDVFDIDLADFEDGMKINRSQRKLRALIFCR